MASSAARVALRSSSAALAAFLALALATMAMEHGMLHAHCIALVGVNSWPHPPFLALQGFRLSGLTLASGGLRALSGAERFMGLRFTDQFQRQL